MKEQRHSRTFKERGEKLYEIQPAQAQELAEAEEFTPVPIDSDSEQEITAFHRRRIKQGWDLYGLTIREAKRAVREGSIAPGALAGLLAKVTKSAKDLVEVERRLAGIIEGDGSRGPGVTILLPAKADPRKWDQAMAQIQADAGGRGDDSPEADGQAPAGGAARERTGG